MQTKQLYLESLGCARNTVDSEVMLGRLKDAGWTLTTDPARAEAIIVNTCSFIEPAINESIDTILELSKQKKTGVCRRLIVAGCLPERFGEDIVSALPEVDLFIGTGATASVVSAVEGSDNASMCLLPDPNHSIIHDPETACIQNLPHAAYLKISEGCNRHCTYCIIPKLRGKHRSRPPERIVDDAKTLIRSGVKELILIAQDTTAYGQDLTPPSSISHLLESLSSLSDDVWFRLLYGHPESIDVGFVEAVARHANICSYFDIPVQHASNAVLGRMGRNYTGDELYRMFEKIRTIAPDAALRTTLITGFPGETDKDCQSLLDFIKRIRFDHLGVFIYSDSEDLASHKLSGHVEKQTAQQRYDMLMEYQKDISLENNRMRIHEQYTALVDETIEKGIYSGRTYFQAPEVDGFTYIHSKEPLSAGSFIQARVTDALEYDLVSEPAWTT